MISSIDYMLYDFCTSGLYEVGTARRSGTRLSVYVRRVERP
eukprot:SAG11_NODE_2552_length_3229_cov_1.244728_2_plen_41_part_00